MSESGASLLITRKDGTPLPPREAKQIAKEMKTIARRLKLTDSAGEPLICSYAWHENDAAVYVITSSAEYRFMLEDVANESYEEDMKAAKELAKALEQKFKDMYTYEVSTSEW